MKVMITGLHESDMKIVTAMLKGRGVFNVKPLYREVGTLVATSPDIMIISDIEIDLKNMGYEYSVEDK